MVFRFAFGRDDDSHSKVRSASFVIRVLKYWGVWIILLFLSVAFFEFLISPEYSYTDLYVARCPAILAIVEKDDEEVVVSSLYPFTPAVGKQVHVETKGIEGTQKALAMPREEREEIEVGVMAVAQLLSRSTSTCMPLSTRSIKHLTIKN